MNYTYIYYFLLPHTIVEMFLESNDNIYGSLHLESGQMRLGFTSGGPVKTNRLWGGVLLSDKEPGRTVRQCMHLKNDGHEWTDDFHEFSLLWRPGRIDQYKKIKKQKNDVFNFVLDGITVSVDNDAYCHIEPNFYQIGLQNNILPAANLWKNSGNLMAPFDKAFYLAFGVGVGGHNDFLDDHDKPWQK